MIDTAPTRVTAVVSTYKPHYPYLATAIESALAQSVPVEVLVTDSACDNAVREFVGKYGSRVRYRTHAAPVGVAENHRTAIAEVTTPYLAILNHDDAWEPGFLETLVPPLDAHPECILAFADHWFMDSADRIDVAMSERMTTRWGRATLTEGEQSDRASLLAGGTVPVAMSTLLRTAEAQRHPIPNAAGPAYDIWLNYALATEQRPYWYSPRRLTRWRVHQSATSAGNPDWYRGTAYTWELVRADPHFTAIHPQASRLAARAWLTLAKSLLRRHEKPSLIREAAERSVTAQPSVEARAVLHTPGLVRWLLAARDRLRQT